MSNQFVLSHQYDVIEDDVISVKQKKWIAKLTELCQKVSAAVGRDIPIQVIGSLKQDHYEKPCTGMWEVAMDFNQPLNQVNCSR